MEKSITKSAKETQNFGAVTADKIRRGGIIALYGDLGSGKTTFVQGLGRGLGLSNKIISPSFIIIRTYSLTGRNFYHIDLYRINDQKEIVGMGLTEIIQNKENIITIEWPEKIEAMLPKERINIYFEYIDANKRQIAIDKIS